MPLIDLKSLIQDVMGFVMRDNFCQAPHIRGLLVTALLLAFSVSPVLAQDTDNPQKEPLRLAFFNDYAPYSWEEGGRMRGILVDVMDEILSRRMGLAVEYMGYPWARAQEHVKSRKADGFVTLPNDERRSYVIFCELPVLIGTYTVFVNRKNAHNPDMADISSIPDLKRFVVGGYLGSSWASRHLEAQGVPIVWTNNLESLLRMLVADRIEMVSNNSAVIKYNLRLLGLSDKVAELPNVLDQAPFNLGIGKQSPYLSVLPEFEETLRKLTDDGTIKAIVERYTVSAPPPGPAAHDSVR
ncbi:substrate-binding periplasmic protein [Nitratidesulfovibrio vulgaris]|nr:transporter substrate-binding domain-containing protein [Nitratidesulfovibrio vulgaris]